MWRKGVPEIEHAFYNISNFLNPIITQDPSSTYLYLTPFWLKYNLYEIEIYTAD